MRGWAGSILQMAGERISLVNLPVAPSSFGPLTRPATPLSVPGTALLSTWQLE